MIEVGQNQVLLDAGQGAGKQLLKAKKDYFNLSHILISHTHIDHVADLMPIIQSIFIRTLPKAGGQNRNEPLIVMGPPGFKKFITNLKKMTSPEPLPYDLQLIDMGNSIKNFKRWRLESRQIRHAPDFKSVAYKIITDDSTFLYTGDCSFCPEIIDFAKGSDTILADCSASIDEESPATHLNPHLAGDLARMAGAQNLILTHFYDINTTAEIKKEAVNSFKGGIEIAKEFKEYPI